jgi:hypothetical protein
MSRLSRRALLSAGIAACALPVSLAKARPARRLFAGPGPIELSAGATHIQLIAVADERRAHRDRIHLRLDDLTTRHATDIVYSVHLNGWRCAGTFRFDGGSRSFDVAALLRDLERAGPLGDRLVVSLVPDGTPDPGAAPRIGGLYLVAA